MHINVGLCLLFYSVGSNLLQTLFIECLQCPRLGQREPLQAGFYVLSTHPHHSLSTSLLSGIRGSKLIFCLPWPSPGISNFSKAFWLLLSESSIEIWVLAGLLVTGVLWLAKLTQWAELENICVCTCTLHVYTHTGMYTHIYTFYVYLFISITIHSSIRTLKIINSHQYLQFHQQHRVPSTILPCSHL